MNDEPFRHASQAIRSHPNLEEAVWKAYAGAAPVVNNPTEIWSCMIAPGQRFTWEVVDNLRVCLGRKGNPETVRRAAGLVLQIRQTIQTELASIWPVLWATILDQVTPSPSPTLPATNWRKVIPILAIAAIGLTVGMIAFAAVAGQVAPHLNTTQLLQSPDWGQTLAAGLPGVAFLFGRRNQKYTDDNGLSGTPPSANEVPGSKDPIVAPGAVVDYDPGEIFRVPIDRVGEIEIRIGNGRRIIFTLTQPDYVAARLDNLPPIRIDPTGNLGLLYRRRSTGQLAIVPCNLKTYEMGKSYYESPEAAPDIDSTHLLLTIEDGNLVGLNMSQTHTVSMQNRSKTQAPTEATKPKPPELDASIFWNSKDGLHYYGQTLFYQWGRYDQFTLIKRVMEGNHAALSAQDWLGLFAMLTQYPKATNIGKDVDLLLERAQQLYKAIQTHIAPTAIFPFETERDHWFEIAHVLAHGLAAAQDPYMKANMDKEAHLVPVYRIPEELLKEAIENFIPFAFEHEETVQVPPGRELSIPFDVIDQYGLTIVLGKQSNEKEIFPTQFVWLDSSEQEGGQNRQWAIQAFPPYEIEARADKTNQVFMGRNPIGYPQFKTGVSGVSIQHAIVRVDFKTRQVFVIEGDGHGRGSTYKLYVRKAKLRDNPKMGLSGFTAGAFAGPLAAVFMAGHTFGTQAAVITAVLSVLPLVIVKVVQAVQNPKKVREKTLHEVAEVAHAMNGVSAVPAVDGGAVKASVDSIVPLSAQKGWRSFFLRDFTAVRTSLFNKFQDLSFRAAA